MKVLIYVALLILVVGCSEQSKEIINVSPLEVIIKEDNISLRLDNEGLISQNNRGIGKIVGNKIVDLEGDEVFSINEDYVVYNVDNDSVTRFSNKFFCVDDPFLGGFTWGNDGQLRSEASEGIVKMEVGIQVLPNDSTLYRTASLMLFYGEYMKG